jgi:hypothetical protein
MAASAPFPVVLRCDTMSLFAAALIVLNGHRAQGWMMAT